MPNALYYGDNLPVLREHVADESVDLIYLDPPFNSNASYNVLFKSRAGGSSEAQVEAFEDTWRWGEEAEDAYGQVLGSGNTDAADLLSAIRRFLRENDMMAYLAMMAVRLLELHRVLKPTGSLYLHCDPTAGHYLKLLLDAVFGPANFRSEIVWRRNNAHNKISRQYGPIHDTILFFAKSDKAAFHPRRTPYFRRYIETAFNHQDERGRYQLNNLTGQGTRSGESGKPWRGYDPTPQGRHWAIPAELREQLPRRGEGMTLHEQIEWLHARKLVVTPKKQGGQPRYKQYPGKGVPYQDIWAYQPFTQGVLYGTEACIDQDVKWLDSEEERLGYPTQKPLGLLARILESSSKSGDLVLDPFCGCGTTIHAAQSLGRRWIGIDVTNLAISLIEARLREAFGSDAAYEVHGTPKDLDGARALSAQDKHQFQWWAISLIDGAVPYGGRRKGADSGIDGIVYFHPDWERGRTERAVVSVKGGEKVGVGMIRDLIGVLEREKAPIGVFVTLVEPTAPMLKEAASAGFYEQRFGGKVARKVPRVQILTVAQLLDRRQPEIPDIDPSAAKRVAPRERKRQDQGALDWENGHKKKS